MSRFARVVSIIAGLVLFVYALRLAGVHEVLDGIRKTGAGFAWIILLSGLRFVVRCLAWRLCVEEPERLSMGDALAAFITGDAIGNLTFFGPVASESTKAMVVRRQLPTISALSSIALENIFYALSVAVMVLVGSLVFVEAFHTSSLAQLATFATAAAAVALGVVTLLLLYRRPQSAHGDRRVDDWPDVTVRPALSRRLDTRAGGPHSSLCEQLSAAGAAGDAVRVSVPRRGRGGDSN